MEYSKVAVTSTGCEASIREPESVMEPIGESYDLEKQGAETLRRMESNLFGCQPKEEKEEEPRCFRGICAMNLEHMGEIDAVLRSIAEKLGM